MLNIFRILLSIFILVLISGCSKEFFKNFVEENRGIFSITDDTKSFSIKIEIDTVSRGGGKIGLADGRYRKVGYLLRNSDKKIILSHIEGNEGVLSTECSFVVMTGGDMNEYSCETIFLPNEGNVTEYSNSISLKKNAEYTVTMEEETNYENEVDSTLLGSFIVK